MSGEKDSNSAERSKTKGKSWIGHFFRALGYSLSGIRAAFQLEMAFRMEVFAAIIMTPVAVFLPISIIFKALVIGSMLMVLVAELLNSSMEWVVDYISEEKHPYAKRAKDMGSAAVFFALVNSGLMWALAILDWLLI